MNNEESVENAGLPPVWKADESFVAVDYSDGSGEIKKAKWADWTCPVCGWFVGEQYIPRKHNQLKCNFCSRCGQKIDWSGIDLKHTGGHNEN